MASLIVIALPQPNLNKPTFPQALLYTPSEHGSRHKSFQICLNYKRQSYIICQQHLSLNIKSIPNLVNLNITKSIPWLLKLITVSFCGRVILDQFDHINRMKTLPVNFHYLGYFYHFRTEYPTRI